MKIFFQSIARFLAVALFFVLLGATCSRGSNNGLKQADDMPIASDSFASVGFSFSEDGTFFDIKRNGKNIKRIYSKDIPIFDVGYEGKPTNPERDYAFDYSAFNEADPHKPTYDPFRNQIYFVVVNQTTAGSVNANRALFSYHLNKDEVELVVKKEMSVSFNDVSLSPSGTYLIFSDGSHGGACENINGLVVFDLDKKREIANLFLPRDKTGDIIFIKWQDNKSFVYKEEILKPGVVCADVSDEDWLTNEKVYTIPS